MRIGDLIVFVGTLQLVCATCTGGDTLTCPKFSCNSTQSTDPNVCVECNLSNSQCYLQKCSNSSMSCPSPSSWFTGSPVTCQTWNNKQWVAQTFEEFFNVVPLALGQECVMGDELSRCSFGDNLVCYCGANCSCVNGVGFGGACDSNNLCYQGYVCNLGSCVKMYSMDAGLVVSDPTACTSNLTEIDSNVIRCTQAPRLLGKVPKQCTSCLDCVSADGSAYTDCVCGIDGNAYCTLFTGDDPWLEYKALAPNQRFDGVTYWNFVIANVQYLNNVPDCLGDVWKDYQEYVIVGPPAYSAAEGLAVLGWLFLCVA